MQTNASHQRKKRPALNWGILSTYRDEVYGLSILWIMLFHGYLCEVYYFEGVPVLEYLGKFLGYGNMGVEIFLFLSGICMYFSFCKNREIIPFIRRRFLRVFPPLLVAYLPFFILQYSKGYMTLYNIFLSLLTLRTWISPSDTNWFASVIVVCYLLYPYYYGVIYEKEEGSVRRTLLLAVFMAVITFMIKLEMPVQFDQLEINITRIPIFILGCGAGKLTYEKKELPAWSWILMVISAGVCFWGLNADWFYGIGSRYGYILGGIPLTFFFAFLVPYMGRYIRAVLRFFGHISLELYFVHLIMKNLYQQGYLFPYEPGNVGRWLAVLAVSIPGAYLVSLIVKLFRHLKPKPASSIDNKER